MHSSFQKLFAEIETQRQKTLDSVRHMTDEQLNFSVRPDKWSVAQILSHLIAGEKLSLLYIKKKSLGIENLEDSGLWDEVKINLLKISQRLPGLKFKAPKGLAEHTPIYKDINSINREWDGVRNELKTLLESIPEQYVNRRIYRHVRAGYMNTSHALQFFREHVIHHTPQIKKLVNQR